MSKVRKDKVRENRISMEMIKLGKLSKTGIIGLIEDISLDRKARVFSKNEMVRWGRVALTILNY